MNWIKENKLAAIVILLLAGGLIYVYANKQIATPVNDEYVLQVGGMDWNAPFEKNVALEDVYKSSTQWPSNHTLCIPVKKFYCDGNTCENTEPKVFNLIGGNSSSPTISRCNKNGCDTYDATLGDSGEYKNIQPVDPKGFVFKMSYNTIDKKFVEVTTLGLDTFVSYGYCMYDFEYKN